MSDSPATITGWLLDLYADPQGELALWLLEDADDCGKGRSGHEHAAQNGRIPTRPYNDIPRRLRLRQAFPISFYAAGPGPRLRLLWQHLARLHPQLIAQGLLTLSRQERRDLFEPEPVTVLAVEVQKPGLLPGLFQRAAAAFPDLTYYDADLPLSARHAAVHGTFPLAKLQLEVTVSGDGVTTVQALQTLDSPWDLDPPPPPLRVMHLSPDCDPRRGVPAWLEVQVETDPLGSAACRLSLQPERALLIGLGALLRCYDPDLLLTGWGDTWLLPHLLSLSEKLGLPLPLNRGAEHSSLPQVRNLREANQDLGLPLPCDARQPILRRPERSYQAYGQVIYRGQQVLLAGRWHIDRFNAMMYHDYALDGILESARVSALPLQQAARLSPGTGISTMQIVTALRLGVMTPWRKQQAEIPKSALDLLHADQGGLVYQPIIGLHRDVAEIDFVSMYPSIMARFNISPETCSSLPQARSLREANADPPAPGLIPQTLGPLLEKRVALKQRIAGLPGWDPRKKLYQARAAAHKWLLVTCFGYLGYKNARFGRIEAHQAVTAYSRECLLRAKEAAEDLGYTVLHMYVDGLWVSLPQAWSLREANSDLTVQAVQPLLDEIVRRTGLPIALEGIYRWVAFLPSRADERVPVANRYFGVFQDGSLKIRGIEARRGDTPPFIAAVQMGILQRLAAEPQACRRFVRQASSAVAETGGLGVPKPATIIDPGYSLREASTAVAETGGLGVPTPAGIIDPGYSNDPDKYWLCANPAKQPPPAWPEILAFLRRELRRLRSRRVPLEQLLVSQKLSRPLESCSLRPHYRSPSPAARAAAQLAAAGVSTRPGQTVRFLYLRGERRKGEDVHAWDCPPAPTPERLDIERYTTLFIRACAAVLQPFGVTEDDLRMELTR